MNFLSQNVSQKEQDINLTVRRKATRLSKPFQNSPADTKKMAKGEMPGLEVTESQ